VIATLDELSAIAPPAPPAVVLLVICPPLFSATFIAFAVIVPALPAEIVDTEILPLSATASDGVDMSIWPAFPGPAAVLKRPLFATALPVASPTAVFAATPEITISPDAFTVMLPADPGVPRALLVAICPPLVRFTEAPSNRTSPARPPLRVVVLT
jgi:hypothetical protein